LLQAFERALPQPPLSLDLYADPPPYYDEQVYRALWQPQAAAADNPGATTEYMRRHCDYLRQAGMLVIAAPVWNHSVPAVLKAWIDLVIAPGHTYRFGPGGIEPLHAIERLLLLISSGGRRTRVNRDDHFLAVLKAPFHYVGINHIDVIWADGQEPALFADHGERLATAVREVSEYVRALGR